MKRKKENAGVAQLALVTASRVLSPCTVPFSPDALHDIFRRTLPLADVPVSCLHPRTSYVSLLRLHPGRDSSPGCSEPTTSAFLRGLSVSLLSFVPER